MIDLRTITNDLVEIEPGLWHRAHDENISFPADAYEALLELEASSYWFEHRNACILSAVRRFPPSGPLFDVGGGNGYVARGLANAGFEVVVVEPAMSGARNARRRNLKPVVCATLEAAFLPSTLPAVGLFDVVEHIEDDELFLRTIANRLKPAGRLYITVPAYSWLWSAEDDHAGHSRRYSQRQLIEKVTRAGFHVDWSSYFFAVLVLPVLLLRTLPGMLGRSKTVSYQREFKTPSGFSGRALRRVLSRELKSFECCPQRLGSSLLLVATRR